jgi:DNA-binding CsgD family transcriptional regulator
MFPSDPRHLEGAMAADSMDAGPLRSHPATQPPTAALCNFRVNGRKFEIRLVRRSADQTDPQSWPKSNEVGRLNIDEMVLVVSEYAAEQGKDGRDPAELLTARELQIVSLVAQGLPTKRIADMLHITDFTVATHLRRAYAKLNVGNRAAMVYRCALLLGERTEMSD